MRNIKQDTKWGTKQDTSSETLLSPSGENIKTFSFIKLNKGGYLIDIS